MNFKLKSPALVQQLSNDDNTDDDTNVCPRVWFLFLTLAELLCVLSGSVFNVCKFSTSSNVEYSPEIGYFHTFTHTVCWCCLLIEYSRLLSTFKWTDRKWMGCV